MVSAVDGGMIGVDIMEGDEGVFALELNINFGFDLDDAKKKHLVVNSIVDELEKLSK